MWPFEKKYPPFVGIDISSSAIKLLELSQNGDIFRVESFSILPLQAEGEKTDVDIEAIGSVVKLAKARSGTEANLAAVSVPVSAAIIKKLPMPAGLNEHEMAAQIELEADQHIPYPLEEVSLDFDVTGETSTDEVIVTLAAARSEEVNRQAEILEMGGFEPKVVDVETFAIERSYQLLKSQLPNQGEGMTVAIIDIGATLTTLYVLENERIVYTREQVFGGKQLTEEIQNRYGISQAEAGRAKKEGGLPDNYIPEVLTPFIDTMTQQINRSLNYFYSSGQNSHVSHLVLAGGCASIPGVLDQIEMETGVSVSIANPFTKMTLASKVSPHALSVDAPSLLTACGLAMRRYHGHS